MLMDGVDISKTAYRQGKYISLWSGVCVFALIKFHCSNHRFPVETGWQQNLLREDRKCMKCNFFSVVWDEFSFPFECPAYTDYHTNNLFVENFFNHLQHIISVDLCLPQREKLFKLCQNLCRKQNILNIADNCHRIVIIVWEFFLCKA